MVALPSAEKSTYSFILCYEVFVVDYYESVDFVVILLVFLWFCREKKMGKIRKGKEGEEHRQSREEKRRWSQYIGRESNMQIDRQHARCISYLAHSFGGQKIKLALPNKFFKNIEIFKKMRKMLKSLKLPKSQKSKSFCVCSPISSCAKVIYN